MLTKFFNLVPSRSLRLYSSIPSTATVARYTKNGPPKTSVRLETESLSPATGKQVTIQMLFAPINPADINMIEGTYAIQPALPSVGGNEGLGKVVAVGDSVSKLKVGDYVIPNTAGFGTWRTAATVEEDSLLNVTAAPYIPEEYLACLSVNPATAFRLLKDFVELKEGDVVIQNGANSMVGMSVIQLAHDLGVKTVNIIRAGDNFNEKSELMKKYGAYAVVTPEDSRSREFRKMLSEIPQPKLALNCVGGETATEMARILGKGGVMVTYGGMSYKPVTVPTAPFIFNDITLKGFWMSRWYSEHNDTERKELFNRLIHLVQEEKLRIWTENHDFREGFDVALDRALTSSIRSRKVLLRF
eukprot:TRINITY_DN1390_c0_g1_i6.p1 TRINITY_DN1390_c0_g1~~TRINITY_DN1390_c0_g1_i6.p1  ORF type:complete len:358 (+),score=64.47 TRINITY_DN1390_c0_g1_i6:239-1312(+)